MSRRNRTGAVMCSVGLLVLVGSAAAQGQPKPILGQPAIERLVTVDLNEVGLSGTTVAQRVTIEPGIKIADHTHTGRTSLLIMLSGTVTEVRGTLRYVYTAGDVVAVAEGATHHAENFGVIPAVYLEIDTTPARE